MKNSIEATSPRAESSTASSRVRGVRIEPRRWRPLRRAQRADLGAPGRAEAEGRARPSRAPTPAPGGTPCLLFCSLALLVWNIRRMLRGGRLRKNLVLSFRARRNSRRLSRHWRSSRNRCPRRRQRRFGHSGRCSRRNDGGRECGGRRCGRHRAPLRQRRLSLRSTVQHERRLRLPPWQQREHRWRLAARSSTRFRSRMR